MRRASFALVVAILVCARPALALSLDDAKSVVRLANPPDPPPAFDASEYQRFVGPGTGTLIARIATPLKDGEEVALGDAEPVFLYPLTPYTNWIISRWADTEVDAIPWNHQPTYPGQNFHGDRYASRLQVPSILIPPLFQTDPPTAVRKGYQEEHAPRGVVVFKNVPPGQYVLVSRTDLVAVNDDAVADPVTYEPGPDGQMEPNPSSGGVHHVSRPHVYGGFLVVNRATVISDKTTYAGTSGCVAVAYYP
jgi:hypothetical protein